LLQNKFKKAYNVYIDVCKRTNVTPLKAFYFSIMSAYEIEKYNFKIDRNEKYNILLNELLTVLDTIKINSVKDFYYYIDILTNIGVGKYASEFRKSLSTQIANYLLNTNIDVFKIDNLDASREFLSKLKYIIRLLDNKELSNIFYNNFVRHFRNLFKEFEKDSLNKKEELNEMKENNNLVVYDIEVFKNLFMIGYKRLGDNEVIVKYWFNEIDAAEVLEVINTLKSSTIIGYNNYNFDDIVLTYIEKFNAVAGPFKTEDIFNFVQSLIEGKINNYSYISESIDVFKLLNSSLKYNGAILGKKIDAFFQDKETISKPVTRDQLQTIIDYNINDIEVTEAIYKKLQGDINLRLKYAKEKNHPIKKVIKNNAGFGFQIVKDELGDALKMLPNGNNISHFRIELDSKLVTLLDYFGGVEYKQYLKELLNTTLHLTDIYQDNYGRPRVVKKLLPNETNKVKRTIKEGDISLEFGVGGLHSQESKLNVEGVLEGWDVQSYYPNNLINQLGNEYQPLKKITKKMLDLRIKAKKMIKVPNLPEGELQKWSDINDIYKIALNGGIYGKLGDVNSPLYNPQAMVKITIYGQHALYLLYRMLTQAGVKVFSINTDGVEYIKNGVSDIKIKKVIKIWENITNLILEFDSYDAAHHQSVNAYSHIANNKLHKAKGVYQGSKAIKFDREVKYPIVYNAVNTFLASNDLNKAISLIKDKSTPIIKYCNIKRSNGGALLVNGDIKTLNNFFYDKKVIKGEYKLIPKAKRVSLYYKAFGDKIDPLELYKKGAKELFNMVYDINNPKLEKVIKNGTSIDLKKLEQAGYTYERYSNVLRYISVTDRVNKLFSYKDGRALDNGENILYLKEDINGLTAGDFNNLDYEKYISLMFDVIQNKLGYKL
jgi:hypothetical protein